MQRIWNAYDFGMRGFGFVDVAMGSHSTGKFRVDGGAKIGGFKLWGSQPATISPDTAWTIGHDQKACFFHAMGCGTDTPCS